MKLIVAAIALLCLVQTNAKLSTIFTPGMQYRYRYLAQSISSMPNDNQLAGIAHKASILVAAERDSVILRIERIQSAKINEELPTVDMEKIPYAFSDMGPLAEKLKSPIRVFYDRGLITEFETDASEPTEVTNIKKAILTLLQLKLDEYFKDVSNDKDSNGFDTYDVMEDGVIGECVTKYVVESNPWPGNPDASVLNITKIKDFEDCNTLANMTFSSHPPGNCTDCDAEDFDPIQSMRTIEYEVKVEQDVFAIERIESRAQTVFIPFTSNGDQFQTNHSQILVLKEVSPSSQNVPRPTNTQRVSELLYEFPRTEVEISPEELHKRPIPFMPLDGKSYPEEARRLLEEVSREIANSHQKPIIHTPYKAQQLARALRTLNENQIAQFFRETESQTSETQVKRRLAIDTILMCGSLPCLHFLLKQVESHQVSDSKASEILTAVPFYVRRPTAPFIESVLRLCETLPKKGGRVHSSCWLAFGSLVDQACGADETTLPTTPGIDTYCDEQLETKYTQAVFHQLQASSRQDLQLLYLHTLSIMGLDDVVDVVKPYARGDMQLPEMVRVKAIYALGSIDDDDDELNEEIISIVQPILMNKDESTTVRIAALFAFLEANPKPHFLERMATITWDEEEDDQVKNMVYSVLDTLSNSTYPCYKEASNHALNALAFAEEQEFGVQDSQFIINDFVDEDYKLGSIFEYAQIASNDSFIPRKFWLKFERFIAGFTQSPLEAQMHIEGLDSILKRLVGPQSAFENLKLQDIFSSNYEQSPKNFQQLFDKLNIDPRDDESLAVFVWAKFLSTQNRMYYFDAKSIMESLQSGIGSLQQAMSTLRSGLKVDYQKTLNFGSVKHKVPSSLGLPIFVQVKTPAIVDFKGKISVQTPSINQLLESSSTPKVFSVQCEVRPTLSLNLMTTMGVIDPFEKIYAAVGLTAESYISLPHQIHLELDVDNAKLSLDVKPSSHVMAQPEVMVFRQVFKPFTVLYPYNKFQLIEKHAKTILEDDTPDEFEFRVGQQLIGVPAKVQVASDVFWQDQGSFIKYIFEENTPLSLATLWFATPDFNYREYNVTIDSAAASNTKLSFSVDVDVIPSKIQEVVLQNQQGVKGILGYLTGWSKMPWQCESSGSQSESYNMPESRRFSSKYSSIFQEDEDEDDQDVYQNRKSKFQTPSYDDDDQDVYQNRKSKFQTSSYDDDDQDDFQFRKPKFQTPSYDDDDEEDDEDELINNKKFHLLSKSSKLRHRRDVSDPAIIQKIPFTPENAENIYKVHVHASVQGNVQRKLASTLTLNRNVVKMTDSLDLKVDIENPPYTPENHLKVCTNGQLRYPKLPCDYRGAMQTERVGPITGRLDISYGRQCGEHKISATAEFTKSEDQIENEKKQDDWVFQQCKEDYQEGKKLSPACEEAIISMGDLKKAVYRIQYQYNELPSWLKNVTYKAENFLKYYFYNQMTDNAVDVHNEEGKLKITTEFDDEDPTIDITIRKPRELIVFNDVYYPEYISSQLRPINARFSRHRLNLDDLTNGYVPPTCSVMGDFINNFDNMTLEAPLSRGCKHIITKDCTPSDLFSILMSKSSQDEKRKELEVHILRHKIQVKPISYGSYEVNVDGQVNRIRSSDPILMISHNHKEGKGLTLASVVVVGPHLHIRSAHIGLWIKFDGESAKISLSNIWKGDVCGLCGEFDGDSTSSLIGPAQCEYVDLKDFLMSYFVPNQHCSSPRPTNRKICPSQSPSSSPVHKRLFSVNTDDDDDEDDDDDDDDFSSTTTFRPRTTTFDSEDDDDEDDDDDDEDYKDDSFSQEFKKGMVSRNQQVSHRGQECFSTEPVNECKPGSYPTRTTKQYVSYTCPTSQQVVRKLQKDRGQRPLRELQRQKVDYRDVVQVPLSCE